MKWRKVNMSIKHVKRTCSICGKKLDVILDDNKIISGGEYFGTIKRHREFYKAPYFFIKENILHKNEYWECPDCYGVRYIKMKNNRGL
jgi:DNA-directed RNA polymerase subunit RPC12/RpoP